MEDQDHEPDLDIKIGPDGSVQKLVIFLISILILGINIFVGK